MAKELDKLIAAIENQNKRLEELISENDRLRSTPFDMTSLERLNALTEEARKELEIFNDTLKKSHEELKAINPSFDNLFQNSDDIIKDIKTLKSEIEKLAKGTDDEKKKAEELEKILDKVTGSATDYYRTANREQAALNKRIVEGTHSMDDTAEKWEQRTRALRKGANEIAKGGKQIYQSLTKTLEPWSKANQEAMSYARTMGMSQKTADAYLSKTISWAAKNNIGILFNKSTDELIKMQSKYSEVLGRNVQLTSEQKKDMLAMEKFLGEDGMMDIANNLENFGLGMSDSAAFIKETLDEATKTGVAASKLTKTIRENIKMAQNYTFKNGLDGLANMAKKAIELKTDMSLVNSFIEKVSTVEGAITTGANLQVLGGSYAMGSDPLSMMYESLNNVEGLFDRAVGMAGGKVFYNEETGNFEMGAMDRYLMKQAATSMGVDPSKMMDVAFRKASLDRIEGQARSNANIANDESMIDLIKNVATWDKGRAVVNVDGRDVDVSDLTTYDKAKLEAMQRTDSQNLQDMAISLRSMNEILSGTQKEINNEQAEATEWAATGINGLLRNSERMLNIVANIGAWGNIIGGVTGILGGVWTTASGVIRMGKGVGNVFAPNSPTGNSVIPKSSSRFYLGKGMKGNTLIDSHGKTWRSLGGGRYENISDGTRIAGKRGKTILANSSVQRLGGAAKALRIGGGAVAGGAISLGVDMVTGEFQKDMGGSLGRAAGASAGAALGTLLTPFFGPLGPILGGWAGNALVAGIQKAQKDTRSKLRDDIAAQLSGVTPAIAGLFSGANALEGNYNKRQLEKLKIALEDGRIDENDNLSGAILRKARANNDLTKMQEQGIDVRVPMASGGYLSGKTHAEGGMPILGSNISVEGGEFVVNKEATKVTRPLLESINNGDYSVVAKQPLGEQMKVHQNNSDKQQSSLSSKVAMDPVSINISGTIKLDSGNKQVDISNELLNNPVLISKLTEMINKQINILENNAYNKGNFKQKFA